MKNVLDMLFSVVSTKSMKKATLKIFISFDGINFPANNNDIDKFEELNHNVSVNVFEVDEEQEQIVIGRKLKNKDAKCHIDLLRIDEDDISHYVYVKDCSRL